MGGVESPGDPLLDSVVAVVTAQVDEESLRWERERQAGLRPLHAPSLSPGDERAADGEAEA